MLKVGGCCCFDLKTGSFIIVILDLIFTVPNAIKQLFVMMNPAEAVDVRYLAGTIYAFSIINILACVMLFKGIEKVCCVLQRFFID